MEKAKTFEQMLKAYKEIRKQVMDANLDDITSVEITEYNDPSRLRRWAVIRVNIGVDGEFVVNQCRYIRIEDDCFDKGMAAFNEAIAERINQTNN